MKGRVMAGHRAGGADAAEVYRILPSFIGEVGVVTGGAVGIPSTTDRQEPGRGEVSPPPVSGPGGRSAAPSSGPFPVRRVFLPREGIPMEEMILQEFPSARPAGVPGDAARLLAAYLTGEAVDFSVIDPDLEGMPDFVKRTLTMCRQIPRGRVITYGGLAAVVGAPRAARAVGGAMAVNPFALVIPCHRVVRSGGVLGGFGGGGQAMKRRLLEQEGVAFDGRGRVLPGHLVLP